MHRRGLLTLALGVTAAAGCDSRPATQPAGTVGVQLGDTVHGANLMVAAERYFADQVAQLSQGRYRIDVVPGGALGDDSRLNEMVRTGQLAFAKTQVSNLTAYDKRLGVLTLPYVFAGQGECLDVLGGELGRRCTAILEEAGLVVLAYFYGGDRDVYNVKRPVHEPADLAGIRLRVPQNLVVIDMINAMGGSAVPMATNDILSALHQHLVDGAENSTMFYLSEQHHRYAPYFSRTRHQQSIDVLLASRKWLAEQPAAAQDAIRLAGRRAHADQIRRWDRESQTALERATAQGAKVNEVDLPAFRRAVQPVLREHRGTFGDLAALLPDV